MNVAWLSPPSPVDWPASALTIGNFDGVHRGHRRMLEATLRAVGADSRSVVLTFVPHPTKVLRPEDPAPTLMTLDQRIAAFETAGIEAVTLLRFDRELAELTPEEFVDRILVKTMKARTVVVGESFRFGRHRAAGTRDLEGFGASNGFSVQALPPVLDDGVPISSSRIRERLLSGEVATAERLLGHPFEMIGRVVRGEGRGRSLGIPTANIEPETELVPATGVYAGEISSPTLGEAQPAVVNIGSRPTFSGGEVTVEVHVLDREADLYGENVGLRLRERLRKERRFADASALVAQIHDDIRRARAILERRRASTI